MRFSGIHKLSSYLMVLSAVAALLLSPEISLLATVLSLAGIGLSWFAEPARVPLDRYAAHWNIATVIFFFYLITDIYRGEPVITAGASFLLFVLVNKLFNRRSSKDYLQAYVVSFLLLVVATTMNTNLSYAVCFCCYTLFSVWTLSLFHLRREMEENYLLKHSDDAQSEKVEVERILNSRRIVGGSFLGGTALLSLGVILGAGLVFTLFPRIGFGLFVAHKRGGVAIAGFRDRVELGHHGVVRDNPTVVMRIVAGETPLPPMRWRGTAFDRYENGVWSHSPEVKGSQAIRARGGLFLVNFAPGLSPELPASELRDRLFRQEIYLDPLDSPVLFAADRPVAIDEIARGRGLTTRLGFTPRRGPLGEIHGGRTRSAGLHYVAYSYLPTQTHQQLQQAVAIDDLRHEHFLQLPAGLPARIGELAARITRGKQSVYEKVIAVQRHLQASYRYTLKLTHDPRLEPVDEFLFVTRRGHCEYFASAMAILLRTLGIHTRSVNGFAGGEWNPYGKYLAVRHGDAHAWVEVLFSNLGWVSFDPTPPAPAAAASTSGGVAARLRQLLDTLRMRWFRHVIEYDLRQQVSILRRAQRWISPAAPGQDWFARHRNVLILAGALLLAVGLALLERRRRARAIRRGDEAPRRSLPGVAQLYARFLALLARRGHSKPPGLTPGEFVDELVLQAAPRRGAPTQLPAAALALQAAPRRGAGAQLPAAALALKVAPLRGALLPAAALELARRITDCYYLARFGGAEAGGLEIPGLLRELERTLRSGSTGESGRAASDTP